MAHKLEGMELTRNGIGFKTDQYLVGAPMAGVHDPPYRMILHDLGLELSYTEMISARAVFEGSRRTNELYGWVPEQGRSIAQIFGSDPKYISFAAREMERVGHSAIDLNAGCPKKKVTRTGAGSYLLEDPSNLVKCMRSIKENVDIPFGVKIRSGFDHCDITTLKWIVEELDSLGTSYIAMHPRTARQQYSGKADRDLIDRLTDWTDVPIMASGDVRGPDDVSDFLERGADAVLFSRGSLGDPSWFRRVQLTLEQEREWDPGYPCDQADIMEHIGSIRKHLHLICGYYGEKRGCIEFRKHLVWYVKRFRQRARFRESIHSVKDKEGTELLIDGLERDWTGPD